MQKSALCQQDRYSICVFSHCLCLKPLEPDVIIHTRVPASLEIILIKIERKYTECINTLHYLLLASSLLTSEQLISQFWFSFCLGLKKRISWHHFDFWLLSIKALLFLRWYSLGHEGNTSPRCALLPSSWGGPIQKGCGWKAGWHSLAISVKSTKSCHPRAVVISWHPFYAAVSEGLPQKCWPSVGWCTVLSTEPSADRAPSPSLICAVACNRK